MASLIPAQPGMKISFRGRDCVIEDSNETSVGIIMGSKRSRIAYQSTVSTESGRTGQLSRVFDSTDGIYFLFEEQIRLIFQKILKVHDEIFSTYLSELIHDCVGQIRRTERTILFQKKNGQRIFRSHSLNLHGRIPNTIRSKPQLIEAIDFAISLGPKGMPQDSQLSSLRRRIAAQGKGWSSTGFSPTAVKMMTADGLTVTDVLRCLELGVEASVLETWCNSRWEKQVVQQVQLNRGESQIMAVWRSFDFDSDRFSNVLSFELDLEDSIKIYASKIPSNYLNSWFINFEEFSEIDKWIAAGFTRPETAREWRDAGFQVGEAQGWYDLDFSSASEAMDWCTSLLSFEDSRTIRELGIFSIEEALEWKTLCDDFAPILQIKRQFNLSIDDLKALLQRGVGGRIALVLLTNGITVETIFEWLDVNQDVLSHDEISVWMSLKIEPRVAMSWMDCGISSSTASAMNSKGFNLNDWKEWTAKSGSSSLVAELIQNFSVRESIIDWLSSEIDSALRDSCIDAGLSFESFMNWSAIGISQAELILEWIEVGIQPRIARIWVEGGVTDPGVASAWANEKFTPVDSLRAISVGFLNARVVAGYSDNFFSGRRLKTVEFIETCIHAGLPKETLDDWSSAGWNGAGVEILLEMLSRPSEVMKWKKSIIPDTSWCYWVPIAQGRVEVAIPWVEGKFEATQLAELANALKFVPTEIRGWDKEGFGAKDFVSALRSGVRSPVEWRETLIRMENERQEKTKVEEKWQSWMTTATQSLQVDQVSHLRWKPFLQQLFNEGFSVTRNSNINLDASGDWYDEVAGRVVLLKNLLRKVPKWPTWYQSDDFKIGCFESSGRVLCWVGKGKRGRLVMFDSDTFESDSDIKTDDDFLVYGLAMSWFLDSSLLLERQIETISLVNGVYMPNKNFDKYLRFQSSDRSVYIRACEIAGHLRLLPDWMNPSDSQRALAPKYLKSRMESQHTYVRPHHRNGDVVQKQIKEHLERYSATASSLSLIGEI